MTELQNVPLVHILAALYIQPRWPRCIRARLHKPSCTCNARLSRHIDSGVPLPVEMCHQPKNYTGYRHTKENPLLQAGL